MERSMRSRFTHTQIHQILKEADMGIEVKDLCRKHGISRNTFYNWKNKYGGLSVRICFALIAPYLVKFFLSNKFSRQAPAVKREIFDQKKRLLLT